MTAGSTERIGIAIVGGGPAGAVLAARLARAGEEVVVFERSPEWRWRAGGPSAVGFDRSRLDPALLDLAASAGAEIRRGWHVTAVAPDTGRLQARSPGGRPALLQASVVVGADGPHSVVARGAGMSRPARLDPRVGLIYHLPDPDPAADRDARMLVLRDGYVGIAPVATGRVNVGIVLGPSWRPVLVRG